MADEFESSAANAETPESRPICARIHREDQGARQAYDPMRHPDAFQSGRDDRGSSARSGCDELFFTAHVGTHFLIRTCVDRLAGDGDHTIAQEMGEVRVKGLHRVQTSDQNGNIVDVVLEIRYRRIEVLPPIGKQCRYRALSLTVLHALEREDPGNRKRKIWVITRLLSAPRAANALAGRPGLWQGPRDRPAELFGTPLHRGACPPYNLSNRTAPCQEHYLTWDMKAPIEWASGAISPITQPDADTANAVNANGSAVRRSAVSSQ